VDDRIEYGEVRVYAIGIVNETEITVIYTDVSTERRIISAWRAERHEREAYWRILVKEASDWKRVRSMSDRQIRLALASDPEARPTDAKFWEKARVVMPEAKKSITIRLDADLLEWLRKQKGYQTRINAVLRTYMDANSTPRRAR